MEHISPILSYHLLMLLDLQQAPHAYLRVTAYWPAYRLFWRQFVSGWQNISTKFMHCKLITYHSAIFYIALANLKISILSMHPMHPLIFEYHPDQSLFLALSFPRPKLAVKLNMLPRPCSLSTQISPPIISASRLLMVSPNPVPPYFRVVEESACANG
jgi:hypothetical protein